jgi:hypothetical protein
MTSKTVENALYTAVGLGVLGFQHIQVQRHELAKTLSSTLDGTRTAVEQHLSDLDERIDDRVDELLASVEPTLPDPVTDAARQAVLLGRVAREHVLGLLSREPAPS